MEQKKEEESKVINKTNDRQRSVNGIRKIRDRKVSHTLKKDNRKPEETRQAFRTRILAEAQKNKAQKANPRQDIDQNALINNNSESLPKILSQKQEATEETACQITKKRVYEQRYLTFLQTLGNNNREKKELEQQQKKRKSEQANRLKDELGFNQIQSKIGLTKMVKERSESAAATLVRSQSAEKIASLHEIPEKEGSSTIKNFSRKNDEYLERIKRRRMEEMCLREESKKKNELLRAKLKDYVMVTVKKNVLDGLYDDEFDCKGKRIAKQNQPKHNDNDSDGSNQEHQRSPKKMRKMRNYPFVSDLSEWKKKNRLEASQRVFIITGGYAQLRKALMERGWVQNPDANSPCFDLKFTLQGREIQYSNIKDFQIVNHYEKNIAITTKLGLTKTLRNSIWINDQSQDNFYPCCFDLNDEDDYAAFQTHFKVCKALSILKIYADSFRLRKEVRTSEEKALLEDLKIRTEVAVCVCSKNIEDINEIIDKKRVAKIVTDKQWEILGSDEMTEEGLAKKKHQDWIKSIDGKFNGKDDSKQSEALKTADFKASNQLDQLLINEQTNDPLFDRVDQLLREYKKRFPQFDLTGHNNIWILKPASLSRGRGITCYNNFVEIEDHIKCKQSLWIAQKYIENPLVVMKRKFDIRQWVLVTSFNPLTIWFYDQCYIRFSAIDYDPKQVSNKFIHLTNNSIGAYYKDFDKSLIKGNMFFQQEFRSYLMEKESTDVFEEKIRPQMQEVVKQSLLCALDAVENRKNTFELFGYDFMVDENYKVWLIEVNSSPSMDYSTHVTTKLVKEVLPDLVKVVVDYAGTPNKQRKGVDTGKFKRIYKGVEVDEKVSSAGLNLSLEGVALKKTKKVPIALRNFSLQCK